MADTDRTQFDYLLNRLEFAAQADEPAKAGYAGARQALFAYVRKLEREAGEAHGAVQPRAEHMCGLQGYNPMLGDSCPACDANRERRAAAGAVPASPVQAKDKND